jgi:hypothetical protein
MTKCPHCQATLPDGAVRCQFCGTALVAPPPVRVPGHSPGRMPTPGQGQPRWIWPAYYIIAGWWILSGLRTVLVFGSSPPMSVFGAIFWLLGMAVGLCALAGGVGLVFKMEWARGIVNVLCFILILSGTVRVVGLFLGGSEGGFWGGIAVLAAFLDMGLGLLMIYVFGETESRAPNF